MSFYSQGTNNKLKCYLKTPNLWLECLWNWTRWQKLLESLIMGWRRGLPCNLEDLRTGKCVALCRLRRRTSKTLQLQVLQPNSFHLSASMAAPSRSLLQSREKGGSMHSETQLPSSAQRKTCGNRCGSDGTVAWRLEHWHWGCFPCQFVLVSRQGNAGMPECVHVLICLSPSLGHCQKPFQPSDKSNAAGRCVSWAWVSVSLPFSPHHGPAVLMHGPVLHIPHAVASWQAASHW